MENREAQLILIGRGGHAKVLLSALLLRGRDVLGFVDLDPSSPPLLGIRRLGSDDVISHYTSSDVLLVNGIGSTGSVSRRQDVYERFNSDGYRFATVIHPAAVIAPDVEIEDGTQLMAGTIVQTGCRIGTNVIVNTGARVDHDCVLESHAHVAPGAVICGSVHVGTGAHVGAGSTVIQGIHIGDGSVVGAGAVVLRDVPPGARVVGIPAVAISERRTV